ncbi:MAG TPA: hypothetical protein VFO10_26495 [Oligoflexus sp.]|uniref:hypothetical protein n=1 Tax=Oligoflexus sp. TaxID=1971216 RepID=UPI002D8106B7|nr:hypothetical protein [Oligoflexus sp.]HET9240842.1 hypothetical protein [Oligoflexus sp.]
MVKICLEVNGSAMGYTPHLKLRTPMKVTPLLSGLIVATTLLGLGYAVASRWWIFAHREADAYGQIAEPERWTDEPEVGAVCQRWEADWPPVQPVSELREMSGIVSSRLYKNILYHVVDSGNEPVILVTDLKGQLLHQIRYAESSTDPEALSQGPCPWGGHCLYIADTGDNFHIRSKKRIHAIDEATLFTNALHSAEMEFQFPKQDRLDVEALAVHPETGDMFLFSKEPKRSLVFRLPAKAWRKNDGEQVAEAVGFFLYDMVTDASWSSDGKRLLLINWQGIFERTGQADNEHSEREGWLPYERKIRLPQLVQQEAVAFLPDQRSIIYTSEKKFFKSGGWGIMTARCIHGQG